MRQAIGKALLIMKKFVMALPILRAERVLRVLYGLTNRMCITFRIYDRNSCCGTPARKKL
jgi:hypothetical protein